MAPCIIICGCIPYWIIWFCINICGWPCAIIGTAPCMICCCCWI